MRVSLRPGSARTFRSASTLSVDSSEALSAGRCYQFGSQSLAPNIDIYRSFIASNGRIALPTRETCSPCAPIRNTNTREGRKRRSQDLHSTRNAKCAADQQLRGDKMRILSKELPLRLVAIIHCGCTGRSIARRNYVYINCIRLILSARSRRGRFRNPSADPHTFAGPFCADCAPRVAPLIALRSCIFYHNCIIDTCS